ncbi:MauE/DoxX family redox-associated membrane protein [Leeuwenhoekiella parthenopeia]|uniref:Methylamine utilisation protein MauE domain-containing protein n=1 Tax=Leeuwenhoekiella parthenopeia TaxID=2890320 RepID=A0ABS8GWS1_9FLAO|nr:MauE/DoxX family redox-associated membrane protein [Leeuwenhoekiella parthenopeia]MCC4214233.1 hypothetical protein [Leeuwenhoekiella parthenopeia]
MIKVGFIKQGLSKVAVSFFILLWVYAATAKLLEFEQFRVQLGQSPILATYAGMLVWLVPFCEYILTLLLAIPKYRTVGLFGSFTLMSAFTAYIIIILNYADYIPCSCGGILEYLGWTEHLIFNGVCMLLAATTFFIGSYQGKGDRTNKFYSIVKIGSALFGSTILVTLLFVTSEQQIHRNNAFVRRYPQHVARQQTKFDLGFNSYYIAGITKDSIYLGNVTAPLHLLAMDATLQDTVLHRLDIPDMEKYSFRSLRVQVLDKRYYLSDGSVPVIFTDTLGAWSPAIVLKDQFTFYKMVPMGVSTFGVLTANADTGEHELGLLQFKDSASFKIAPQLLEKQIDGIFDVDGFLQYNPGLKKLLYVYRYRNEFLVMGDELELLYRGKTIDTLTKAQLDIATSSNTLKIGPKSIAVNLNAATAGKYLFISSDRLGRYEPAEMLDEASIIDVYDLQDKSYVLSFYLYDHNGHSIRNFIVKDDKLYAIYDKYLIKYTLKADAFNI